MASPTDADVYDSHFRFLFFFGVSIEISAHYIQTWCPKINDNDFIRSSFVIWKKKRAGNFLCVIG